MRNDKRKVELSRPVQILTTTVFTDDGHLLPVRTDQPIAKSALLDRMKPTKSVRVSLPNRRGDVIPENFTESGVRLIACKEMQ